MGQKQVAGSNYRFLLFFAGRRKNFYACIVKADAGKAALMKGPLVYCLEEKENGRLLSEIFIEENTSVEEMTPAEGLVGNVPTLSYKGIRVRNKGAAGENQLYGNVELEKEEVSLQAVPYCMWNNRGEGEMLVWHKLRV